MALGVDTIDTVTYGELTHRSPALGAPGDLLKLNIHMENRTVLVSV